MRKILKLFIAFFAILNLVALFVFDYQLGMKGKTTVSVSSNAKVGTTEEEKSTEFPDEILHIEVNEETLYYDGKETLDLAKDVTVIDAEGNAIDTDIFTAIKAGNSTKDKVIEYSATDDNGNKAVARRNLKLSDDYHGPTIEVLGDIPKITEEELENITRLLIDSNLIKCDDGFGNDITSSVTTAVKSSDDGIAIVTLKVVNLFNDTVSKDVSVEVNTKGPVVHLLNDKVTIEKGSSFNYLQYIEYARDDKGRNLSSRIRVKGKVDTNIEGEYKLEIYTTDYDGVSSKVKTLTVTVK